MDICNTHMVAQTSRILELVEVTGHNIITFNFHAMCFYSWTICNNTMDCMSEQFAMPLYGPHTVCVAIMCAHVYM